jgi:monofunctional biosynthetic peptidoglycan transglycosylase
MLRPNLTRIREITGSKQFRFWLWRFPVILFLAHIFTILLLRWVDPQSSAYIRRDQIALKRAGSEIRVQHEWVDISEISWQMELAVIAAEDQKFPHHMGFDLPAIKDAMERNAAGGRTRGASTISQQVVKNLYLWPSKGIFRKGLEAYLTLWIELLLPKQRILEIYLNIAQFDDHVFGVGAASRHFFGVTPAYLTSYRSALLASVLPSPTRYSVEKPSGYLYDRVGWILNQMAGLGKGYLEEMDWRVRRSLNGSI